MADYGFRAINENSGSIQIDQNYQNLELRDVITVTTLANVTPQVWGDVNVFTAGNSRAYIEYDAGPEGGPNYVPILVVCASPYNAVQRTNIPTLVGPTGNRRLVYYITWAINQPVGTTVKFYVFTVPKNSDAASGYGLVVYNEAGNVTFNSNNYYLNIAGVVTGANYAAFVSQTFPAGRAYAAVAVGWSGRSVTDFIQVMPGGQFINYSYDEWCLMPSMNANVLVASNQKLVDSGIFDQIPSWPGNQDYTVAPYTILVIDITNFP